MPLERWPNKDEMGVALYGGSWADPEAWAERCRPDGCVICTSGRPYRIIGETAHTWITTDAEVALFGYVCVISKAHVVEPFQLPEAERAAFWREAMAIAEALNAALSPVKMNYEIHGNTLPHLHMHLLPRRVDDAFVGRPVDLRETHHRHTAADIEMLSSALGAASDEGL